MLSMYPNPIESSNNGSLEIFTGIFYMVRIFGLGLGVIQQSSISSANGGYFLEQNIFSSDYPSDEMLSYFEASSTSEYYHWGFKSQPRARVAWTSGENENDDYPIELRNLTEVTEDIFEDPSSAFFGFEPYSLKEYGYQGIGYKIKPLSFHNGAATFGSNPKSPNGWWLQIDQKGDETRDELADEEVNRWTADYLFVLQPQNFKLYGETSHLDIGEPKELVNVQRTEEYLSSYKVIHNPNSYDVTRNVTMQGSIHYDLYVQPDTEFNIFSGITVYSPETTPSRKYFDFENTSSSDDDGILNLKATKNVRLTEEIELEPFSRKNITSYVTYLHEMHGIRYFSWIDVSAVADVMGENGEVLKNVLVKDVNLLRHLIKSRGYEGEIKEVNKGLQMDCAKLRIKVEGSVRGILPIPFIQFQENDLTDSPKYVRPYATNNNQHLD